MTEDVGPGSRRGIPGAKAPETLSFGLLEALGGLAAGFVLASLAVTVFAAVTHHPAHPSRFGTDVASLCGLWAGLLGSVVLASNVASRRRSALAARLVRDYGLRLRPWPDIPLGLAAGLGAQFVLVPLLELPLAPFVPHLFHRLGDPARQLTTAVKGPGLVVLGLLVCLGSPLVEELFFRGLLLRSIGGRLAGPARVPRGLVGPLAVLVTSVVFGLVHFEALQLIWLVGFGAVVGTLAWRTGRLGPGIVAHVTFNAATFVSLAALHPFRL